MWKILRKRNILIFPQNFGIFDNNYFHDMEGDRADEEDDEVVENYACKIQAL